MELLFQLWDEIEDIVTVFKHVLVRSAGAAPALLGLRTGRGAIRAAGPAMKGRRRNARIRLA